MTQKGKVLDSNAISLKKGSGKLSDHPKNKRNPFLEIFSKDIRPRRAIRKIDIDNKHNKNEGLGFVVHGEPYEVKSVEIEGDLQLFDYGKFIKLFCSDLDKLRCLPYAAYRILFDYILPNMLQDTDKFEFQMEDCLKETEYKSEKDVYIGLRALVDAQIIARGYNSSTYYINPHVVFNGDRRKLYLTGSPSPTSKPSKN